MKDFIKKNKWYIFLTVAFLTGLLLMWFFRPTGGGEEIRNLRQENQALAERHVKDSVEYQKTNDSLVVVIDGLKKVSSFKAKEIVRLRALFAIKKDSIKTLPPTEAVSYFETRTGEKATIRSDSSVITTLCAITVSNVLFAEQTEYLAEVVALESRMMVQDTIISKQGRLLNIKDERIVQLTNEYHATQRIIADQEALNKKLLRSVRTKNAILVTLGGIAVGTTLVAILKD